MQRRPLQEVPAASSNMVTNFTWAWDPLKSKDLLSGMGVSDMENLPLDIIRSRSPTQKRQKVHEKEKDQFFVIARRPKPSREPIPDFSWSNLPDELLLGIFSYLPLTDLLKVSQVCKRWHRLSFDESLWHSLDVSGKTLLSGVLGQVLSAGIVALRCPRACVGDPLFKNSRPLRVQHIDLSNCTISVAALQSILCCCHRIQNLSLEGLVLSDEIIRSIAQNLDLVRLNLSGCSGFSAVALEEMLKKCNRLEELNLSWCDFTADHVNVAVHHIPTCIRQLNLSGYRQNLLISDLSALVGRCLNLICLDLSDSVMLTSECFSDLWQLVHLQDLSLSRCYQISPATLLDLGEMHALKNLSVFGIVPDSSLQLLMESLPRIKINCSPFTSIARPTMGSKKSNDIWGIRCRLSLRP
ncbi:LOW QUALITY PROTEIN: S-phase kinase-associated protein 2 [Rhinatrema bivittatum]|uniref:LOW QUALITY PROTEIN: S-phase kinase-associated protein 2 n=1 Tax=Rhinatrema bivittatum TaxID=194408 RepID=UPI00112A713A|nr:LOW QUALITY PROTEIN: S-phase kinase-associated protein 2 [Rhinatrema bivittatum]